MKSVANQINVNPIIIIEKLDKSLKVCLDPKELRIKNIIREMNRTPTIEEIKLSLFNKKYFTLLDLRDGFYQCELDQVSQDYCCFSTPFGNYKYLMLPFGLSSAPEKFQQITSKYFGDIKNVIVYFDNILVSGSTIEERDLALNEVIKKAREFNIKFNSTKLQYKVPKVKFLGFLISSEGIQPDEERIRSIKELKEPSNKKDLQFFLGMINYLRGFFPNLSETVSHLRELLKKDIIWCWSMEHKLVFKKMKDILCSFPILNNFNLS